MKSVQEARTIILDSLAVQPAENLPLRRAFHRVLAEDIVARHDIPAFDNTSMDGYAVVSADTAHASETAHAKLNVSGEVSAGKPYSGVLKPGESVRIMTGAPIPDGADAVIEQEAVRASNGAVEIGSVVQPGRNIRRKGEDVRAGTVIVRRGTLLSAAQLGVLVSAGASSVQVYRKPAVAVLTTGNELVDVDAVPAPGQIRNSNAYSLWGLIHEAGAEPIDLGTAKDDPNELRDKLREGLKHDALVTSGGVSVGAYDYVLQTLEKLGVNQKFWKVNIKPGMPFFYGVYPDAQRKREVPVLGLPGNPVSTMVTFLQFVRPALQKMMGREGGETIRLNAKVEHDIHKKDNKRHFIRGVVRNEGTGLIVTTTGTQSSGALSSMAKANCFIVVPEDVMELKAGEDVGIELF